MNSRNLIRHTEALLKEHESIRLGLVKNDLVTDRLTQPIAMEEEDILERYLEKNKITGKNECGFIRKTYLGCIKRGVFLETTLQKFLAHNRGIYLKKDYYIYAIICYLAIWRIEEIGFSVFCKFVRCFDPKKMAALIDFLFKPSNIEGVLKPLWCSLLDEHFVRDKIIHHLLPHSSNAFLFEQDLKTLAKKGMEIKKTEKITKQDPFLLTVPKPRRLPQPTHVIPTNLKARPIPKSLRSIPKEQLAIDSKRLANREMAKQLYEEAQTHQFQVAKKLEVGKKELLREKIKNEELEKQEKLKPRSKKDTSMKIMSNVKSTTAAILREEALLRKKRKEQQEMIAAAELGLQDVEQFEAWKEKLKIKEQEERMVDLERKRLEVQLLHEETFLARKDLIKENKEKVAAIVAEKKEIQQLSEELKKEIEQNNLRKIGEIHAIKEGALKAKANLTKEKVKNAASILYEKRKLQQQIQQQQKDELERKAQLIQQIRLLELSQNKATWKEIDLTQSSGLGLLGEMSIAELQERLVVAKAKETEAADQKRREIQLLKDKKDHELQLKLQRIDHEREERRQKRINKCLPDRGLSSLSIASSTMSDLKELLFEKDNTGKLKSLQAKILQKRSRRLAERTKMEKTQNNIGGTSELNNPIDELDRARNNWEMEEQQIENLNS